MTRYQKLLRFATDRVVGATFIIEAEHLFIDVAEQIETAQQQRRFHEDRASQRPEGSPSRSCECGH